MIRLQKQIARRFSTLIIPDPNRFSPDVLSLITAAQKFEEPIKILQLGTDIAALQEEYNKNVKHELVSEVSFVENENFNNNDYEWNYSFIKNYIKELEFNRVIMVNSPIGKEILPKLSVLYKTQAVTDITHIEDKTTFQRPIYAGNAVAKVQATGPKAFLGIRNTNFDKSIKQDSAKEYESKIIDSSPYLTDTQTQIKVIENKIQKSERPDLADARVVISGGRALKSAENFNLLYQLSDKIPLSAIGASRAAVDAGYISNDLQIGQTGRIVAPELYIAFGISGAIQHVAGMKDSKIIVAVNKDEECPIFSIADYGLVGDLFKIVPELIEKIDQA